MLSWTLTEVISHFCVIEKAGPDNEGFDGFLTILQIWRVRWHGSHSTPAEHFPTGEDCESYEQIENKKAE